MIRAGGILNAYGVLPVAGDEPPVTVGRNPAREAAERELSRPRYHENDPSLFQRALNRFWDWVGDLFSAASGATPGGMLGLVVILLVLLALAGLLWWRLGRPERSGTQSSALFDERPRTASEHRSAAAAHAVEKRWSQAVQERMRAVVRSLEERALLDPRPGRTAGEAATEAGIPLPDHASLLRAAARDFDDITYGGRTADEAMYTRISELDQDLERTKPELAAASGATA